MSVNGILFLITISRKIQFGLAQALTDEKYKSIYIALQNIVKIYMHCGFTITHILEMGSFRQWTPASYCKCNTQHCHKQ